MYRELDGNKSQADMEKDVLKYWKLNNIEKKSVLKRPETNRYVFFEGPPTANGLPGLHHIVSRTFKDVICRYKTMQGFMVERKGGWDTHGLPVELEVEKELGLSNKAEIENYGLAEFNDKCRKSVMKNETEFRKMTERIGYWVDMDDPYKTMDNSYIESVWWLVSQFWKKGLVYKGHKILPYCPRCGTPLSSHEVSQGYKDVKDLSAYVKFRVKNRKDLNLLVWTTTPWTLTANVAVAVNKDEKYCEVLYEGERFVLAEKRVADLFQKGAYSVERIFSGKELAEVEYEPLYLSVKTDRKAFFVVEADFVSAEEGSGLVHIAPAFGEDDYNLGKEYNLPLLQPVDESGKFTEEVGQWHGKFVKDCDVDIVVDLKKNNLLFKSEKVLHSYPHCWRCSSPLLYYARESWYLKTSSYRDKMVGENKKVKWFPGFVGEKRFENWLKNNKDWAFSRDRYWGTPLNIWVCGKCGHDHAVESVEMLKKMATEETRSDDLHRPFVDEITLNCPYCNGEMKRTPEVLDCWFDSGAMPFAQWHYPFENSEKFRKNFPADFVFEGIDQTRGWFYTLLAISTFITGKAPFRNVLVNDMLLDAQGNKMSKSKGNIVKPWTVLDNQGADALRWYLLSSGHPYMPRKFDEKGVTEVVGKFQNTLKNSFSFFVLYSNLCNFNHETDKPTELQKLDKWMLSRLNSVKKTVLELNNQFDFTKSTRVLEEFALEDVSNWYIRLSRKRFWQEKLNDDKKAALSTLRTVLLETAELCAPFVPFMSEVFYRNLGGCEESVHLEDYPSCEPELISRELEMEMKTVQNLVKMGRSARNSVNMKVRQPLLVMFLPEKYRASVNSMKSILLDELNVKELCFVDSFDKFLTYEFSVNYQHAGPVFGKDVRKIESFLGVSDHHKLAEEFFKSRSIKLYSGDREMGLSEKDLLLTVKGRENYAVNISGEDCVVLDTNLNDELELEGLARECVNRLQFMRKERSYEVLDTITVEWYSEDEKIKSMMNLFSRFIAEETLTSSFHFRNSDKAATLELNGRTMLLSVTNDMTGDLS